MKHSRDISDSTTIEAHLDNLVLDTSLSSRMTVVEDKGASQTFRIITGVALLAFGRQAMFRDISRVAIRTLNSEPNTHATS